MKLTTVLFMACVLFSGYSLAQRKAINSSIMQVKKNVDMKLCADIDYSDDVIAKIEQCNRMDPHYKLDQLYKECHEIVSTGPQNWNQKRKFNCKIRDCYDRIYQTTEYNNTWIEIRKLSDYEMEKRQTQKIECLEKVMSMK